MSLAEIALGKKKQVYFLYLLGLRVLVWVESLLCVLSAVVLLVASPLETLTWPLVLAQISAVAEAGGMTVLMDILAVATGSDVISQAANLVRLMLNNHTVQEYATPELLTSLTIVVEKELWKSASVNEELLQAIEGLLGTFSRLRFNECSTSCIPVLIGAMKVGSEVAQETALNILWLLRQGWSQSKELARVQSVAMGDAIPVLQLMLRSGPVNLYEKAETLLSVLPGQLSVCIKRGVNLKTTMGGTSAYCKIMLGEEAPKLTKVGVAFLILLLQLPRDGETRVCRRSQV